MSCRLFFCSSLVMQEPQHSFCSCFVPQPPWSFLFAAFRSHLFSRHLNSRISLQPFSRSRSLFYILFLLQLFLFVQLSATYLVVFAIFSKAPGVLLQDSAATSPSVSSDKSGCKDAQEKLPSVPAQTVSCKPATGTPAEAGALQSLPKHEESLVALAVKRQHLRAMLLGCT